MFRNYHYLNTQLNSSARCFVAYCDDVLVGFCAVIHFPHARVKNMKRIHRLVVLPDYQGMGIGKLLLHTVAAFYAQQKYRVVITTSHPAMNSSLRSSWKLLRQGRIGSPGKDSSLTGLRKTMTLQRDTCSWEYCI